MFFLWIFSHTVVLEADLLARYEKIDCFENYQRERVAKMCDSKTLLQYYII